ncbi:MAG: hypothetical protein WC712_08940 [Candidatus Brocadiia bacterium]
MATDSRVNVMWIFLTGIVFLILAAIFGLIAYNSQVDLKKGNQTFEARFEGQLKRLKADVVKKTAEMAELNAQIAAKKLESATLEHQMNLAVSEKEMLQTRIKKLESLVRTTQEMTQNIATCRDELVTYYSNKLAAETDSNRIAKEDLLSEISTLERRKTDLENRRLEIAKSTREEKSRVSTDVDQTMQDIESFQAGRNVYEREDEIDCKIILVNNLYNFVIIDAGAKEGIKFGQRFKVFQYDSNRVAVDKGLVICRIIGDHVSYAQVVRLNSTLNPVLEGDFIASPLYSRSHTVKIAVIGKLAGYRSIDKDSQSALDAKLVRDIEAYGAAYSANVTDDCDFVVVSDEVASKTDEGVPDENMKQLRTAKEDDIVLISEIEFLQYLAD